MLVLLITIVEVKENEKVIFWSFKVFEVGKRETPDGLDGNDKKSS